MTAITAASIVYDEPFVTKVGGVLFTVTNVTTSATEEEYVEGGIELNPEKLGLTVGLLGETKNTECGSSIWCNPVVGLKKPTYEEGKQVTEGNLAQITTIKGKPFLRVFSQETAGIGKPVLEAKTATKAKLKSFVVTVFAFGK